MSSESSSRVLHDVVVEGRFALGRLRGSSPVEATNAAMPSVATSPVKAPADDEARRRGYEEGFAKGCLEGRAKGAEEAHELAAQAAEQAERERVARHEQLALLLKQEAQATCEARLVQLNSLIAALPSQIEARLQSTEDDMLALCFEVVSRLLGESVARPDVLGAHLRQAMDALRNRPLVAIHLHPDDLVFLEKAGVVAANVGGHAVRWLASTEISLGGCILETPEGGLDARFETQLQALREVLQHGRAAARATSPSLRGTGD